MATPITRMRATGTSATRRYSRQADSQRGILPSRNAFYLAIHPHPVTHRTFESGIRTTGPRNAITNTLLSTHTHTHTGDDSHTSANSDRDANTLSGSSSQ